MSNSNFKLDLACLDTLVKNFDAKRICEEAFEQAFGPKDDNIWTLKGAKKDVHFHLDNLVAEIKMVIKNCQYRSELRYLASKLWLDSIRYPKYEALMEKLSREITDALFKGKFNNLPEEPESGLLGL